VALANHAVIEKNIRANTIKMMGLSCCRKAVVFDLEDWEGWTGYVYPNVVDWFMFSME
jgi:hypothetical protein